METSTLLLGAIAVSTLVMALVQIGVIIYGARLAKRVNQLVDQVEHEIRPAIGRVNAIGGDVNRATTLVVAQLERADKLFAQGAERVDHVMTLAENAVVEPVKQGVALLQGLGAALTVFFDAAARRRSRPAEPTSEDEEALFIG